MVKICLSGLRTKKAVITDGIPLYRSNGHYSYRLGIYCQNVSLLFEETDEAMNIGGFDLLECLSYFRQDETGVYFGWDDIKWYDEYFPEIIAMTDTLTELEGKNIPFQFIRVGEDDTDIVHLYHLGDSDVEPFYVHTEIRGGR